MDKEAIAFMIALALIMLIAIGLFFLRDIILEPNSAELSTSNAYSSQNVSEWIVADLRSRGYGNYVIYLADIGDSYGDEYLCMCQQFGQWYIFVYILEDDVPQLVLHQDLSNSAVYLVEENGLPCLMIYSQQMATLDNGLSHTQYEYRIQRINAQGQVMTINQESAGYTDGDQDASAVAAFLSKLNGYLVRIVVIRDPYRLTGQEWVHEGDVYYGSVPQQEQSSSEESEQQEQNQTMGFVQIHDPSSWLNLRVGPGTQYAKVLLDPGNPNSFVRQALGSPVTVLETIETGDPKNPVWVKIRITYADREIIGYSSKKYIRIIEE